MPANPVSGPPLQPIPQPVLDETDIVTTNLYRFSGYKFVRDMTGNILYNSVPAYKTEPIEWAARAVSSTTIVLLNP